MDTKMMTACLWSGLLAIILLFIAMFPAMGFLPPLAPSTPDDVLAAYFRENATSIIFGSILMMLSSALFFPFIGGLAAHMKRMEGDRSPLTYSLMTVVTFALVPLFVAPIFFTAAAYRPGYSHEMIRALSDLGFFFLVIPALPAVIWCFVIGLAVLGDDRSDPIYPRWVGYFNLWLGVLSAPGCVIGLFKAGPFAWNGVLAFWIPAGAFGAWIVIIFWAMNRAISRDAKAAR